MATGTHTLLERITVGGAGAASVTFSSIPQTGYTDLKIVGSTRSNRSAVFDGVYVQPNNATTNLSFRYLEGNGASASSGTAATSLYCGLSGGASGTASTFGNWEVMIPNYASANYKSFSIDTVQENNSTTAYQDIVAGLWSSSAAITSLVFICSSGNSFTQYSTFSLYGIAASGVTPLIAPKAVGGDIIQTDGTYWYHAFINTGAFVPAVGLTCDVLVIAGGGGGGGGGNNSGAGGGAGGVVYTTSQIFSSGTSYTTTVGAGGTGGYDGSSVLTHGVNGGNSNVTGGSLSLTAAVGGGGGGGNYNGDPADAAGYSGGSGGGSTYRGGNIAGGAGTSGQGNAGGTAIGTGNFTASGGGGAGAVGANSGGANGAAGGAGINTYSSLLSATGLGVSGYIAGGGGGSGNNNSAASTGGAGGSGGGGAGGNGNYTPGSAAVAGTANTGSGGGGRANAYNSSVPAGAGGSGLIIIRYPV